jgi:hypothetical protein
MSGVHAGSRSQLFHRVRLYPAASYTTLSEAPFVWYQIMWQAATATVQCKPLDAAVLPSNLPEITLPLTDPDASLAALDEQLQHKGWLLHSCGTCANWEHTTTTRTEDGLAMGLCRWQQSSGEMAELPPQILTQSVLSLECHHWQGCQQPLSRQISRHFTAAPVVPPVPRSAALDIDRLRFWPRMWAHLRKRWQPAVSRLDWRENLVERSGVGAGTESCFACQGRIANLGALAVSSPEGDKQTLSVWRCRSCHTTYFNDWIDRWERVDTLETEELYYRVPPALGGQMLDLIFSEVGGEHPAHRAGRNDLRTKILMLVHGLEPLSRQIRQGR